MGDGTTKAIAKIKIGDRVQATDPVDGKNRVEPVTALHDNHDTDLADVTIKSPTGRAVIHTTANHPFWDETTHRWTSAGNLRAGDKLLAASGRSVRVTRVRTWTGQHEMYNLTINVLHTYYVFAGSTPILVHNVDEGSLCDVTLGPSLSGQTAEGVAAARGDTVLPYEQKMINEFGDRNGCAACGARTSGYKDGHWTGDHNPPNKLSPNGPWTLYPHCAACSRRQGGIVNGILREWYDFPGF